jgi:SAM-dependent methyltransferase
MSTAPLPPEALAIRVGVNDPSAALESFDALGADARRRIVDMLPGGWAFDGKRVLDFGCGPGKVLRHFLDEAGRAQFEGCDIHPPSVEWVERHLNPPVRAFVNEEAPPLARPDGSYDLIWAMSVFTHLAERSLDWLLELHRVLDEGGLLIATTLGRAMWESREDAPWDEDGIGMAVVGHGEPWDAGGPVTYISRWWLDDHWGRLFEVVDVREGEAPGEHTLVLLRKRSVDIGRGELEAARDEREVGALRTQIELLRRDVDRLREGAGERQGVIRRLLGRRR